MSLGDEGELGAEIGAAGVKVYALGLSARRLGAISSLRKIVRAESPDLVQAWLYRADLMGLLGARGIPLIWNLRCSDMELGLASRALRKALASLSHLPTAIIANSEAGRRFHERVGYRPKRWEVIPNGFDIERFYPDPIVKQNFRRSISITDEPLIGMVARVDPMKDHGNFLAAAEIVAQLRPDTHFILAGRGTETLVIPPSLRSRVTLGSYSHNRIPALMAALDVLVVSSAYGEGFPNVLGEAMACGAPCVSTDVGDARSIIGETGFVVPPRDSTSLAHAIVEALRLPWMPYGGRDRIVQRYSLPAIAQRYKALYENILSAKAAPARSSSLLADRS